MYDAECRSCEIVCNINTEEKYKKVRNSLLYDLRRNGSRGRALAVNIPELGLERGDRLEPGRDITDVGEGLETATPPFVCLFWRRRFEVRVRHRNPLFCPELGIDPSINLALDFLHVVNLGVMLRLVHRMLWALIDADFTNSGEGTMEARAALGLARLRFDLSAYYRDMRHRGTPVDSEIQDLTGGMIGSSGQAKLGFKAGEIRGILPFAMVAVDNHTELLRDKGGPELVAAGEVLLKYVETCHAHPRIMPPQGVQEGRQKCFYL